MTGDFSYRLPVAHELRDAPAAVATKHHKTATIARALGGPAGLRLQTAEVDTDLLGTFTGETPRTGTPRDTAVAKARWACQESRLDLGIGSEGSFFPHPDVGLITIQVEHVALVQPSTGLNVIGTAVAGAPWALRCTVAPDHQLGEFDTVLTEGAQRLIVRPDVARDIGSPDVTTGFDGITKGIDSIDDLRSAIHEAANHSDTGRAIVESDLRAHQCPPRHDLILAAAKDLGFRLATRCPACCTPGFGHQESRTGAPCAWCAGPTATLLHAVSSCPTCGFTQVETLPGSDHADPGTCPECNP